MQNQIQDNLCGGAQDPQSALDPVRCPCVPMSSWQLNLAETWVNQYFAQRPKLQNYPFLHLVKKVISSVLDRSCFHMEIVTLPKIYFQTYTQVNNWMIFIL